ncbi:hypothetical protein ACFLQY_01865 [Verrucomicrobiota bacterium]
MKQPIKTAVILLAAGYLSGIAHAEFGISAGASFNFKASFRSTSYQQEIQNDPGTATAGTDHFYDDGYNRVDNSGNVGNLTSFWGYQNASQDDGAGNIIMSSSRTTYEASASSVDQSEAQPAIELYWQKDLTENKPWDLGLRVALLWQHIEIENRSVTGATTETISDSYAYTAQPPSAPFNGSFTGPNYLLSDIPTRSITYTSDAGMLTTSEIDADLFTLKFGPTLSCELTEKVRLTASAGGAVAWIDSDFSYSSGSRDSKTDWLFGAYAGADIQYLVGKRWGIFSGAAYTLLENFDQQAGDRSVELQFDDSYTLRAGIFFK